MRRPRCAIELPKHCRPNTVSTRCSSSSSAIAGGAVSLSILLCQHMASEVVLRVAPEGGLRAQPLGGVGRRDRRGRRSDLGECVQYVVVA